MCRGEDGADFRLARNVSLVASFEARPEDIQRRVYVIIATWHLIKPRGGKGLPAEPEEVAGGWLSLRGARRVSLASSAGETGL